MYRLMRRLKSALRLKKGRKATDRWNDAGIVLLDDRELRQHAQGRV